MGYAIADQACERGHAVTLISGPTRLNPPNVRRYISIETAEELLNSLKKEISRADCLIMCAAVGDFRVKAISEKKIKRKGSLLIKLVPNKDILKELSKHKKSNLFVGFSLETENLEKNAYKKLKNKDLDLIVANRLTKTHNVFGDNKLGVCIIEKTGHRIYINNKSKQYISQVLLDKIEALWYLKRKGSV